MSIFLIIDSGIFAMDSIFNEVCILLTAAFALTLVPGFRRLERSLLSRRDQGTALLVFLILGLVEEATVSLAGWLNERIVAIMRAYLEIESLRLGDRLKVEQTIDPDLLKVLMPPFSLQPL